MSGSVSRSVSVGASRGRQSRRNSFASGLNADEDNQDPADEDDVATFDAPTVVNTYWESFLCKIFDEFLKDVKYRPLQIRNTNSIAFGKDLYNTLVDVVETWNKKETAVAEKEGRDVMLHSFTNALTTISEVEEAEVDLYVALSKRKAKEGGGGKGTKSKATKKKGVFLNFFCPLCF